MRYSLLANEELNNEQLIYNALSKNLNSDRDLIVVSNKKKSYETTAIRMAAKLGIEVEIDSNPTKNTEYTIIIYEKDYEIHKHLKNESKRARRKNISS